MAACIRPVWYGLAGRRRCRGAVVGVYAAVRGMDGWIRRGQLGQFLLGQAEDTAGIDLADPQFLHEPVNRIREGLLLRGHSRGPLPARLNDRPQQGCGFRKDQVHNERVKWNIENGGDAQARGVLGFIQGAALGEDGEFRNVDGPPWALPAEPGLVASVHSVLLRTVSGVTR